MREIALGFIVSVVLVFTKAFGYTQGEVKNLDKECRNGSSEVCATLGESYLIGINGLSKNYKKASFYYEKVCKKGSGKDKSFLSSCINLGRIYSNGGHGIEQNYKKACEFYTLACDGGDVRACQIVGVTYEHGRGVLRDITKAALYYKKACEGGVWLACKNFATYHYQHGDKGKATSYFKKACELGENDSMVRNVEEVREIWQEACDMYSIVK